MIAHARVHEDDITGVLLNPERDRDSDPKLDWEAKEAGSGAAVPPDSPPSSPVMDAPVAYEPYRGSLWYNPWICGYTR